MGVPAFFRWLTKKYPSVIVHCIENKPQEINGTKIPVDSSAPNPNGVEFDNLYLDMNGIIHPCTHPEDKPAPKNEDEMMVAIFECIDRLFRIVRPRKLLYMAIDGVAPRAKMNQQRSRRFRASKETSEKIKEMDRIREELIAKGCEVPPAKAKGEHFDSNCITPGTPFMDRLSHCLHYYIHDRLNNDPGWNGIKVILSDANVPGEGEHKIMDYIRKQRAQPNHDPNTSHCLCGADADLIMLALATHEPNFTIIREEFKPNKPRPCDICGQLGHEMQECLGLEKEGTGEHDEISMPFASEVEFIFVRINVLREFLEKELTMPGLPFPYDLDRAIDDWVFMCFFVGNDFLPHLPSLEIRENAIDRLVELYKRTVYKTKGWLTESGIPNLTRVQMILTDLGEVEDEIFKNRQENELKFKARMKAKKRREADANCYNRPSYIPNGQFAPVAIGSSPSAIHNPKGEAMSMRRGYHTGTDGSVANFQNKGAALALKSFLREGGKSDQDEANNAQSPTSSNFSPSSSPSPNTSASSSLKRKAFGDSDEEENNDEVRLWEDGFKDRYYESKFSVNPENTSFREEVARQYAYGLCWVLRYYYQGCASWKWYFPYHYAPFASDFKNLGDLSSEFEKNTQPFSPLEQLMSVFPAASRSHVPEPWAELMLNPESEIIDFYPEDFQIDLNGKKYAWQGVALLPFVDEVRLKAVLAPFYDKLTDEERRRNKRGDDRLYVRKGHKGYDFLIGLYENEFDPNEEATMDPEKFEGTAGYVLVSNDNVPFQGHLSSPISSLLDVDENLVVTVRYRNLKFADDYIFPSRRLPNAEDPPKVLKPGDLSAEASRNWRPQIGMAPPTQRAGLHESGHRTLGHHGFNRNDNRGSGYHGNRDTYNPQNHYFGGTHRPAYPDRYRPYDSSSRPSYPRRDGHGNNRGGWNNNNNTDYGHSGGYNSSRRDYGYDSNRGGGRFHQQSSYDGAYNSQHRGYSTARNDRQDYGHQSGRGNHRGSRSSSDSHEGRGYYTAGYSSGNSRR